MMMLAKMCILELNIEQVNPTLLISCRLRLCLECAWKPAEPLFACHVESAGGNHTHAVGRYMTGFDKQCSDRICPVELTNVKSVLAGFLI